VPFPRAVDLLNATVSGAGVMVTRNIPYGPSPRQMMDIYRPARTGGPMPVVVFFYGGAWQDGERRDYRFVATSLARAGVVTAVADYRLYPEVRYPDFLQDCALAVGYGLEHARELGADPRRVFLYGHSAGAYNVAMLALDPRWLRAVGHSPDELAGWVGLAGPYNFLPIEDPEVQRVFDWPATSPDTQPINHVGDLTHPLPVFLGAAVHDKLVYPQQNSIPLADRMKARGTEVRYQAYEHVNHALLVGALSWPLTPFAAVLDDTTAFMRAVAPIKPAVAALP